MKKCKNISVGIANSIAKINQYSWGKTIEYARELNINYVQFYIDPGNLPRDIEEISSINLKNIKPILHLPVTTLSSDQLNMALHCLPETQIIIQHEKNLKQKTVRQVQEVDCILGYENDNPDLPNSYLKELKLLRAQGVYLCAVLDLPRFFHQNSDWAQTEKNIFEIIAYTEKCKLPVILHLIDSMGPTGDRKNWRPLFEGDLPLNKILRNFIQRTKIESIILEYESVEITKKSLSNLNEILNNIDMNEKN